MVSISLGLTDSELCKAARAAANLALGVGAGGDGEGDGEEIGVPPPELDSPPPPQAANARAPTDVESNLGATLRRCSSNCDDFVKQSSASQQFCVEAALVSDPINTSPPFVWPGYWAGSKFLRLRLTT